MIHATLFKSPYDNRTCNKVAFDNFEGFERWLYKLSEIPMMKPEKGEFIDVHHAPLISPAMYDEPKSDAEEDKVTRCNEAVVKWGRWAALDVDDFEGTIDDIDTQGLHAVIYSTASSKEDHLKFRMVFPITEEVYKDDLEDFWYALNRRNGCIGDEQVKDMSRMYYIPGHYPGAYNFIKTIPGDPIDAQTLIRDFPQPLKERGDDIFSNLPSEMQREMLARRFDGLTKDYTWTSYRDCPFVNRQQLREYRSIVGTGWYHKLYGVMVSIACKAFKMQYMITADQIADLAAEIHLDTRGWPSKRNLKAEAERAIDFAVKQI